MFVWLDNELDGRVGSGRAGRVGSFPGKVESWFDISSKIQRVQIFISSTNLDKICE